MTCYLQILVLIPEEFDHKAWYHSEVYYIDDIKLKVVG